MRTCTQQLQAELSRVHYLGPLRSAAKRIYITKSDAVPAMDAAGDFLPYVLRDQRKGNYSASDVPPGDKVEVLRRTLKHALDNWMYYLRTGEYAPRAAARTICVRSNLRP